MFPKAFLAIMRANEALVMAYLINISNMERDRTNEQNKKYDGWFTCKRRRIFLDLLISQDHVTKLFKSLKNKGFIETKWKGQPGRMWIKINILTIHNKVQDAVNNLQKSWDEDKTVDPINHLDLKPRFFFGTTEG